LGQYFLNIQIRPVVEFSLVSSKYFFRISFFVYGNFVVAGRGIRGPVASGAPRDEG
jgi:hypothetical protein